MEMRASVRMFERKCACVDDDLILVNMAFFFIPVTDLSLQSEWPPNMHEYQYFIHQCFIQITPVNTNKGGPALEEGNYLY